VTQRTTAALGLAVLTTLVTKSRAQLDADRGALLGTDTVTPGVRRGDGRAVHRQRSSPRSGSRSR
jgi:hypothetical protein